MTNATNNNATNATLAARAAGLLTKSAAYAVAEKAMGQAIAAKRVYPPLAEDFGAQLGVELPLKTKDFTRVVGHMLAASEKPLKGVISKRKSDILAVLADLVGVLTDTQPIVLPSWALPKERAAKKPEEPAIAGTLERANGEAAANEAAENLAAAALAESKDGAALARAVAVVVANAAALSDDQREALMMALASTEAAIM